MSNDAYVAALQLLARRELSEAQLRRRLARKRLPADEVDAAVVRLKDERSLDDVRVAGAIARSELGLKQRSRLRVRRTIEAAGIAPAIAEQAVAETFAGVDPDALLASALDRRLRGRAIAGDGDARRLYRYLVGQGFEPGRVADLLRRRRKGSGGESETPLDEEER